MKYRMHSRSRAGFSLVEVMVALAIVSIGLLGIAKMQALALSSTGESKMRALAALEAASLASTMQADRDYWAGSWAGAPTTATLTVTAANGAITSASDTALQSPPASLCQTDSPVCTPPEVAAEDLNEWVAALGSALPSGTATITCNVDPTGMNPVYCTINLNWTENVVALNTATNAAATQAQNATALQNTEQVAYALNVEP